jgi:hypothetical protein
MEITLGKKYRDQLTGFEGIAVGYCEYITGCNQVLLVPRGNPSKRSEVEWFDEQRLKHIEDHYIFEMDNDD